MAGEATARARPGAGPTLVIAESYRHEGHYYGDPQHDRAKGEVEDWRAAYDPLVDARAWLTAARIATAVDLDGIDQEVDAEMERAVAWAETGPPASPITPEEIYASS